MESIEIGTIDLSSFSSGYEHTFAIELPGRRPEPDRRFRCKGDRGGKRIAHSRHLQRSNIACKGVSQRLSCNYRYQGDRSYARALSQDALNRVKPEDITVIADLSDYGSTTGQIIVNAKVSVAGHDNVGAVGDVRVTVTIYKD